MTRSLLAKATVGAVLALAGTPAKAAAENEPDHAGYPVYRHYCAVCHGVEADGLGPVAPVLRQAPTDLRMLGQRYGTPLPVPTLLEFIDGREMPTAHGTREMPVWGRRLLAETPPAAGSEAFKRGMIYSIVSYLESVQVAAE